jgi:hypothetical protein
MFASATGSGLRHGIMRMAGMGRACAIGAIVFHLRHQFSPTP